MLSNQQIQTADQYSVCSLRALKKGAERAMRNVRWKNNVLRFDRNLLTNIYRLHTALYSGQYKTDKGYDFTVTYPKKRTVTAVRLKDRVVQSSFVTNVFYPLIVPMLNSNNCACIKGRGTDYAIARFKEKLRECSLDDYCLKADIKDYFGSISHDELISYVRNFLSNNDWLEKYYAEVINSNEKEVGIGLGSEINQLSASLFLNSGDWLFDNGRYIRYVDDIVFFGTKRECLALREDLKIYARTLGITLHPKKTYIQPVSRPISFLGFTFLLHDTGKITAKRKPDKLKTEKRRLVKMKKNGVPFDRVKAHYTSVRGTMKKGCRSGVVKLDAFFNELFREELRHENPKRKSRS